MSLEEPGSGFDLPRDDTARTELFVSVVTGYVNSGKNRQLRIMVIGEAGQGKSTLINALVGSEVAKEGDQFKAGTSEIQQYKISQNEVDITIWDTPGFGMASPKEDEKMVEKLKVSGCRDVDLALFCVRMDTMRFPTRVHYDTIIKLNEVFGRGFWKYCLFVLTFANNVQQFCPVHTEMIEFFSQRCLDLEEQIKVALHEYASIDDEVLGTVRAVPVGSYKKGLFRENPWALPDREDWFIMFWLECTEHMHKSALSALLRANYHRLEAGDASQSICPPPHFDAHDRLLQATTEEVSEIRLQIDQEETHTNSGANSPKATTGTRQRQRPNIRSNSQPSNGTTTERHVVTDVCSSLGNRPKDTVIDVEESIHSREVPLYVTLCKQLEDANSGFFEYVSVFVKEERKSNPYLGHLKGLINALKAYLSPPSQKKNK